MVCFLFLLPVLWNIFTSHNFSINPRAEDCACYAISKVHFVTESSRWASCFVCLLPWTPSRCSGCGSGAAGCSARWLWVKEHLLPDISADGDVDVAEQVESKEKVLKNRVSLGFIYKVCYGSRFSWRHAGAFSLEGDSQCSCCTCKYTGKSRS